MSGNTFGKLFTLTTAGESPWRGPDWDRRWLPAWNVIDRERPTG